MRFILRAKTHTLSGKVGLPASKSISNRLLIIRALAQHPFEIHNLSNADDTASLKQALDRNDLITDVGPAGTAMRFLTALYASQPGEKVLTGSDRMKQRPIAVLVDALRQLGANISYLEKDGYPPLHIEGRRLTGGRVEVAGDISSQFITALMLIGPTLPQTLTIAINGNPLSRPYILMTQKLMQNCGAQVEINGAEISVQPGRYRSAALEVEQDWSAASFWMAFASLARKAKFTLIGLRPESVQGDSSVVDLFESFGLASTFTEEGLAVTKTKESVQLKNWDFRDHPDLVQPSAVAAAALGMEFRFDGLDNLRLKETDRISALQTELAKIGVKGEVSGHSMSLGKNEITAPTVPFEVYSDHRMAMSLACLSMVFDEVVIRDPMVVSKSYPSFWKEVEKFVDVRPGR